MPSGTFHPCMPGCGCWWGIVPDGGGGGDCFCRWRDPMWHRKPFLPRRGPSQILFSALTDSSQTSFSLGTSSFFPSPPALYDLKPSNQTYVHFLQKIRSKFDGSWLNGFCLATMFHYYNCPNQQNTACVFVLSKAASSKHITQRF